ncbi:MAG: hypothetical protein M1115_06210 [Actinobacteria bacterium]|nr:hypothetical protein [Actinomycetota bacterium]
MTAGPTGSDPQRYGRTGGDPSGASAGPSGRPQDLAGQHRPKEPGEEPHRALPAVWLAVALGFVVLGGAIAASVAGSKAIFELLVTSVVLVGLIAMGNQLFGGHHGGR